MSEDQWKEAHCDAHHFVLYKNVEQNCMPAYEVHKGHWVVALIAKHELERVNENESKLSNLKEDSNNL